MTDQSDATQADADAQSQADTTSQQDNATQADATDQASDQTSTAQEVKDLPKWAQKLIADTRKEASTYRTKAQQYEDANKTEMQRVTDERDVLKTELQSLKTEIRESRAEAAFIEAAKKDRARGAKTMFHAAKDELAYDDDGNPTNIAEIIARIKKDDPDLFEAADSVDNDAGNRGQGINKRRGTESASYQFGKRPI